MHLWDVFSDPSIVNYMQYLSEYVLEGPGTNYRVQVGTFTLSCTQNVLTGQTVTFNKPFAKGVTPTLFLFVNPSTTSSVVTPSYANLTNTGFQGQVYSNATQSVTVNYLAIGQVGGA